jgi:hypothetical protein
MRVMHLGALRRYAAVAPALAAFLLASCEPIVEPEMFGLSPTPRGVPEIRLAGCLYAWSVFLTLAEVPGQAPGPSDALWRLRPIKKNRSGILPKRFLIGSVPEGWTEAVPLQGDLAPDVQYRIYVSSGEAYIVRLDFSLEDLRPGYILDFAENLVPIERFPLQTTCEGSRHG